MKKIKTPKSIYCSSHSIRGFTLYKYLIFNNVNIKILTLLLMVFIVSQISRGSENLLLRKNTTWRFDVGPSPNGYNFTNISLEVGSGHLRTFGSIGLGTLIGGIGTIWYSNPNNSSLIVSASIGALSAQAVIAYQVPYGYSNKYFLIAGASYIAIGKPNCIWLPILTFRKSI